MQKRGFPAGQPVCRRAREGGCLHVAKMREEGVFSAPVVSRLPVLLRLSAETWSGGGRVHAGLAAAATSADGVADSALENEADGGGMPVKRKYIIR